VAAGLGHHRGGILGLHSQLLGKPATRRAVQFDLLSRGHSLDELGSEAFSWYDLLCMSEHLQRDPNSALTYALHGSRWTVEAQLMAVVADTLAIANWQRAGRKSAPRPKPIPRPWEKVKAKVFGSKPVPISQFNDWWDSHKPKRRTAKRKPPATDQ
jgi:hypothetical protein